MVADDTYGAARTADVPPSPAPPAYTGHLLRRAYLRTNRLAPELQPVGGGAGSARDFQVLDALSDPAAATYSQQDLGEVLGLNRTTMVKLIDRLEAAGQVARTRNPGDRRSYLLTLTDEGQDALRAMGPALAERDDLLTTALTPAERARLDTLLADLLGRPQALRASDEQLRTGSLITQAHHLVRHRIEDALADAGLQARHFGALNALAAGPCSQQQLARVLGVSEQAVLQIVDDLAAAGLVVRDRDPQDRRRYALRLSEAGEDRLRRTGGVVEATETDFGRALGAQGRAELRALLAKLLSAEA